MDLVFYDEQCSCSECTRESRTYDSLSELSCGHCRECRKVFNFKTAKWDDQRNPYCSQACLEKRMEKIYKEAL